MKTKRNLASIAIFLAIGFVACNKDANEETDVSQPAFETEANNLSDEIEKSADIVTFDKAGGENKLPESASVSVTYPEGTLFPKIITIDYGETNC